MKKLLALVVVMVIACAPLSFASACPDPDSYNNYGKAAGAKLVRGVSNVALGWVELFRQPAINENKWEGVGQGIIQTIARTGDGALEAVTFFIPQVKVPVLSPSCPFEMDKGSAATK